MIAPAKRVENNYNKRSTDDPEERLIEVTQNDRIIGKVSRVECHNESRKPWHRSTHIYLFSPDELFYFTGNLRKSLCRIKKNKKNLKNTNKLEQTTDELDKKLIFNSPSEGIKHE